MVMQPLFTPSLLLSLCLIAGAALHRLVLSLSLTPPHHLLSSRHHASSRRTPRRGLRSLGCGDGNDAERESRRQLLESLRAMRASELKRELKAARVSTRNALEKEELVQRLFAARTSRRSGGGGDGEDGGGERRREKKKKKKKKRRRHDDDENDEMVEETVNILNDTHTTTTSEMLRDAGSIDETETERDDRGNTPGTVSDNDWTLAAPFIYHELEASVSVAAQNAPDVYIRPSRGKFAAIHVRLSKGPSASIQWTLLVDTACSGLVLSPSAVSRAKQQCPGMVEMTSAAAATMTMAGSSQGAAVARWDSDTKMTVGGMDIDHDNVAACQDIGAMPSGLDGILGLSFLDKFACVDFDFVDNELRCSRLPDPRIPSDNIVAEGPLCPTKLRIYTADVTLDGRGPVKMLVDTGAASTFLNWKGVADMRLSSSSPQIEPIRDQIGAMGADNMALRLTHRFQLKRRWNTVAENTAVGDLCPGIALRDGQHSDIDICDLPVLETLKGDGVGGVLGADLLMMCDVVRFCGLNGGSPRMILMKR